MIRTVTLPALPATADGVRPRACADLAAGADLAGTGAERRP